MRTSQYLTAKHRIGVNTPAGAEPVQCQETRAGRVAAVMAALDDIGRVVANQSFSDPDALTEDAITAYALALMRLRECACAAALERLTKACDALAVTVARLIEDKSCACRDNCTALRRFVAHAHAMLQLSPDLIQAYASSIPAADWAMHAAGRNTSPRASH
jgi:hypothetical protein